MTVTVPAPSGTPLLAGLRREKRALPSSAETRTSSNSVPYNVYINDNFMVSFRQWFRIIKLVEDSEAHGIVLTEFVPLRKVRFMKFGSGAHRLLTVPNAGGSSVLSEVMSYEMMERCFGAMLAKVSSLIESCFII